jgi:hypothetical protein
LAVGTRVDRALRRPRGTSGCGSQGPGGSGGKPIPARRSWQALPPSPYRSRSLPSGKPWPLSCPDAVPHEQHTPGVSFSTLPPIRKPRHL